MKRSKINPISKKKAAEKRIEEEIRQQLLEQCQGLCQNCGKWPTDGYGLSLHHIKFKSRGGKSEISNCCLVCRSCHEGVHLHRKDLQGRIF